MIFFITFLRALAACFITNAHYTGIYPTDLIANGGLIGDILFFAVSGYCLCNIQYDLSPKGFLRWYGKRIWRVYPPVILMTIVYVFLGKYVITPEKNVFWWFVYPTYYHFVASIIVLYIPYFFCMKISAIRANIPLVMGIIGVIWLLIYIFLYDKTFYHIDNVRQPMIRFLFMESMLLGSWFRIHDLQLRNHYKSIYPIIAGISFILYFASKMAFSKIKAISSFQFVNQIVIFVLLFFVFRTICGLDEKLETGPKWMKKVISFISNITLEIYVVQYVIIDVIRECHLSFPINWLVITGSIIVSAFILHYICKLMYSMVDRVFFKASTYEGKHA